MPMPERCVNLHFLVHGVPAPQGSKSAVMVAGRPRVIEGKGQAGRAKHTAWRSDVATAAHALADEAGQFDEPLAIEFTFRLPMPRSRPKRLQAVGEHPSSVKPDLDKLIRSTLDGLVAGGLLRDDALAHAISARKLEVTGWTGAVITITTENQQPQEAA